MMYIDVYNMELVVGLLVQRLRSSFCSRELCFPPHISPSGPFSFSLPLAWKNKNDFIAR